MANTIVTEEKARAKQKERKAGIKASAIRLPGFTIDRRSVPKMLPHILIISVWAFIYIANHHYGERTLAKIDKTRREVKELKAEFQTTNAQLSNKSMQSEVVKAIAPGGVKALVTPPQRLKVKNVNGTR